MMEWVRNWLIGISAAAFTVSLADSLLPDGTVKKIGKFAGGLLMIAAILQPITGMDFGNLSGILTEYRLEAQGSGAALELENDRLVKMIIEEETSAYIQNKAAELGIKCSASVSCRIDEDGNVSLSTAIIYGSLSEYEIDVLSRLIEGELAIQRSNQRYERKTEQ